MNILSLIYIVSTAAVAVVLAFVLVQSFLISKEFLRSVFKNKPHKY